MKRIPLSLILLSLLLSGQGRGATVYIDPTCSNNGDGTTTTCAASNGAAGPFKAWSSVTWAAGNTYAQKGGTTTSTMITVGASGMSGNPITITSYGTGQAILDGTATVSSGSWTANDPVPGVYSTPSVSEYAWYEDGNPLQYSGPDRGTGDCAYGNVDWDAANYTKNYYKPTSGTPASHTVQYAQGYGLNLNNQSYITVNNFSFRRWGFDIVNPSPVSGSAYNNITITNCTFDDSVYATVLKSARAVFSNVNISNNTYTYDECSVELWCDNGASCQFDGVTIANNTLPNCSQKEGTSNIWRTYGDTPNVDYTYWYWGWSGNADTEGIGVQNLQNSNVYGNTVVGMCRGTDQYVYPSATSQNNNYYNNFMNTYQTPIVFEPDPAAAGFENNNIYYNILLNYDPTNGAQAWGPGDDSVIAISRITTPVATYNTIYNNTMRGHNSDYALYIGTPAYFKVYNNIMFDTGNLDVCLDGATTPTTVFVDYNLYNVQSYTAFNANDTQGQVEWSVWKETDGFDADSPTPSTEPQTPGFTNGSGAYSTASDFTLQPSSPAKWAGILISGLTTDYAGNPVHDPPSLGAYEYTSSPVTYTITASAGTGGTINPTGTVTVAQGLSQGFQIVPNTGYAISNVVVDTASVGAPGSYTFASVMGNHTIAASFALREETITASAGAGGTIAPSGSVQVPYGTNQTFTIKAKTGYDISSVTVDGSSVGTLSSYTFNDVTTNHTIAVSFTRRRR